MTPAGNTAPLFIGQFGGNTDRLAGTIDEARIYNRALTQTEIQQDMNTAIGGGLPLLTVTKSGTGTGAVTSSPAGINCGATCSASFASGTSVTLTAAASVESTAAGFSGGCVSATTTCTFTITANATVTATFNDTQAPTAPSGLTATTAGSSQVNLSWTASTDNIGVTGYKVERCAGAGCTNFAEIAMPITASYSDTGLTAGTGYSYRVRATDAAGNLSAYSNVASATTAPTAPSALSAFDTPADQGKAINLSWTVSTSGAVSEQRIYRATTSGGPYGQVAIIVGNTTNTYTNTGLTNGTTYYYVVRASDGANESANSNQASAAPIDNIAPVAPTNLAVIDRSADNGGAIDLSWTVSTSTDVTQQRVYRSTASGGPYTLINTLAGDTTAAFTDTAAAINTTYYYIVRAYDGTQESADSPEASGVSVNNVLVTYTYDGTAANNAVGQLISVDDNSGNTQFSYDKMGRITKTDKTVDGTLFSTSTSFDLAGRVNSVTYPDGDVVFYKYEGPALTKVSKDAAGTVNYALYEGHNALGQPATVTFGNGVATTYTYSNAANGTCPKDNFRLCKITTNLGTTKYQDLTYSYDNNGLGIGNVTGITDSIPTDITPPPGVKHTNQTQSFGYDDLNRLTSASGPYGAITYAYDQIGNMTCNSSLSACTASSPNYTYGDAAHRHAVTNAAGTNYIYNANGDMIQRGADILAYDTQRRLSAVTNANGTTNFVYDGDGGRVKKVNGAVTNIYIGKLFECVAPCKVGGVWSSSGTKHIFAGSARIAMKPVTTTGEINYFHADHLGSTSVVTDQTGAKRSEQVYLPYGDAFVQSGTDFHYKYTGQEKDGETGLYFYNARYYDSKIGRFISADSIVQNARDPQDLNRYSYVNNSPIRYIDPSGHWKLTNFLESAISVGTVVGAVAITFICECPAYLVLLGSTSAMALTTLRGGDTYQIVQSGIISGVASGITAGAVSVANAPLVAASNPFLGGLATVGVGGFVNGSVSTLMYGGSARQAIRAGYQGASIAVATAAVMYGVDYALSSRSSTGSASATGQADGKPEFALVADKGGMRCFPTGSDCGGLITSVSHESAAGPKLTVTNNGTEAVSFDVVSGVYSRDFSYHGVVLNPDGTVAEYAGPRMLSVHQRLGSYTLPPGQSMPPIVPFGYPGSAVNGYFQIRGTGWYIDQAGWTAQNQRFYP